MKKCTAIIAVLLVAGMVRADITENFQIGGRTGNRDARWDAVAVVGSTGSYSFTNGVDSDLLFTITAVASNGDELVVDPTHLSVNSSGRQADTHTSRISDDESVTITVSYVDPNSFLTSLTIKEFGAYWGNGVNETTVFTDASANSTNLVGFVHADPETLIDYSATGLDALSKDNTGTWSMTVSADHSLGTTTTGLGGFELEYTVIPEPATLGLIGLAGFGMYLARCKSRRRY
jgi:hypothetical protein